MLCIGLNATSLSGQRAGAGNYIFNLVKALADIDRENRYFVFAKPENIAEWNITQPNFHFVPIDLSIRPLRLLWEQCVLPWLVRSRGITVFHSPHYTMPVLLPCRSVVTIHDVSFILFPRLHGRVKRWFFTGMLHLVSKRAHRVIAVSESTRADILRRLHTDAAKVSVVLEAADKRFISCPDSAEVRRVCATFRIDAGRYLLFVGILEPRKNIPLLLNAYRLLVDQGVGLPLVIAGKKGWMFKTIFSVVKNLGLQQHVIFTGYVDKRDLPCLYNGARLFVYPSLYEGFGLPVLEAMACGTPVVTSNVSSMPQITGDAALLVSPADALGLAAAMRRLTSDDALHAELRQRGLKRAAEFSWENAARQTLEIYVQK
jgi:glycosyltransferase involved in cell wall biosynthesis